jgi:hypothetical protein
METWDQFRRANRCRKWESGCWCDSETGTLALDEQQLAAGKRRRSHERGLARGICSKPRLRNGARPPNEHELHWSSHEDETSRTRNGQQKGNLRWCWPAPHSREKQTTLRWAALGTATRSGESSQRTRDNQTEKQQPKTDEIETGATGRCHGNRAGTRKSGKLNGPPRSSREQRKIETDKLRSRENKKKKMGADFFHYNSNKVTIITPSFNY